MNTDRKLPLPIAIALALVIVMAGLGGLIYVVSVVMPARLASNTTEGAISVAKKIGMAIDAALHVRPLVTVNGTVVVERSKSIAELSTIERRFEQTYSWENTWLGSTKRLRLKGTFVAKAGYDLTKPFSIDVSADQKTIRAAMPPARINSLEQTKIEILDDDTGLWNRISLEDRQQAQNELLAQARASATARDLLKLADTELAAQLDRIIRKNVPSSTAVVRAGDL
jgi:hypothetical protein